jgi:hypothetical protein
MKANTKQSTGGQGRSKPNSQRDMEICAQKTERWFFYPNQREHPEYANERRRQDRSLQEFS